ncbi:MAG: hypothetical protein U0790_23375 [Isosphaeraceae bacterium]
METTWFTRYGIEYTGQLFDIDLAKGIASYHKERHCSRCGGAGRSEKWRYTGLTCHDCGGTGKHKKGPVICKAYTAEKLAKLNVAQEKAQAKRQEKKQVEAAERARIAEIERQHRQEQSEAWKAAHADVMDGIRRYAGSEEEDTENFFNSMWDAIRKYGKLSDRQLDATRAAIAREEAKRQSQYVGTIGERIELTLTIERVIPIGERGLYGQKYLNLCRDQQDNRIVYKGTGYSLPGEGKTCRIKATVDSHTCYKGEKQTIIARPKRIEAKAAA